MGSLAALVALILVVASPDVSTQSQAPAPHSGAAWRPGAGEPRQASSEGAVRPDGNVAAQQSNASGSIRPRASSSRRRRRRITTPHKKATKEGKVYRNDIGLCWPAGMPIMMTRVWPVSMIQLPTSIFMIRN